MPKLTKVIIRRFKQLEEIEVDLAEVTLLIGANNAGKSSILQAIHFAVSIAQTARLVGEGVSWQRDSFELSFNPSQLLYSPVSDVLSLATGGSLQEPRATQIEIELHNDAGDECIVGLRRGRNRNVGVSIRGRVIGERLMDLREPFTVFAPGLAGVPKEERYMSSGVVRRIVARGDANLTLRNVLRMLHEDAARWAVFVSDMQKIFGQISIEIDFNEDTDESIEVFFQFPDGPRLQVDAAGTSVLQAAQILAYINLFKPQVLILDEPDSHLHPDNQRLLCELVFNLASERGFQALISTHSRHVLDSMKHRGSIVWLSKGRMVDQPDFSSTAVLMDIGALDSADYFADGQSRCVVASEDVNKTALSALLFSNGFIEQDTEISTYAGCSKVESAVVLGSFLADKAPNISMVVHRDRDYMEQLEADRFEQTLESLGFHPFLTMPSDVEGYFLNSLHLHALNPAIPVEEIDALINKAIQDSRHTTLEKMINLRTEQAFRRRQAGGGSPNHGRIAATAQAELDADPRGSCRGKEVLKCLQALLQQRLRANPRIYFPSEHLVVEPLRLMAQQIWPN
jgi:energy-coupling factor transporter ATP-binding protein EcfA2